MKKLLFACTLVLSSVAFSQGVKISNAPGQPDASAGLEIDFTDKGLLMPRLSTTQRNAIVGPAQGLMLFNTTTQCVEVYFTGAGWLPVRCTCINPPDAGFSFSPSSTGINSNVTFTPNSVGNFTYQWTFQGGTPATSNAQNPVVQWASSGTYTISLIVTDANQCKDTTTATITVTSSSTLNTYNAIGQEYLLQTSMYSSGPDQLQADCFCMAMGYNSAASYTLGYISTYSCYGYTAGCTLQNPWCSGVTQRHVITTVTCQ